MRENKGLFKFTLFITIITFLFCLSNFTCKEECGYIKLLYDFSLACFGSALLGMGMSIISYCSSRRDSMEEFYQAAVNLSSKIKSSIIYFDSDINKELIIRALEEEQYDDLHMYFLKNTDKQSAKDEIINQLLMENEPLFEHDSEQKVYTVFLNDLRNRVKTSIDGYLLISELKTDTLANAYGRLDFMFGNKIVPCKRVVFRL